MTRSRAFLTLALSVALLTACSAATTSQVAPVPAGGFGAADAGRATAIAAEKGQAVVAGPVGAPAPAPQNGGGQPIPVPLAFDTGRALILTATVSLLAKDPWAISERAQAVAIGLGGDVLGLAQAGKGEKRSATLTLRVPAARFNDALRQIRDLDAEVVSSNVDGKDVTDQFVDLQARLRAKQAEEQRYLVLMSRAEKIDDILKLDNVLAQTRTQIEQLTGQVSSMKTRTEYATITVTVATTAAAPAPVPVAGWDPARTAALAAASLAALLRVVADVAIWALVLGTVPALAALAFLLTLRARRRPAAPVV